MTAVEQLSTVLRLKAAAEDLNASTGAALGAAGTAGGGVLGSLLGGLADPSPKSVNKPGMPHMPDTPMDRHMVEYWEDILKDKPEVKKGFSPYLRGKNKFKIGGGIGGAVGGGALTALLLAMLSNKENSKSQGFMSRFSN